MTDANEAPSSRGPQAILLLALAIAVIVPLLLTDAPQDDAYISYRFAANLAAGDGIVFNAGEEPVEGYTNFLWVVILALAIRLGMDPEIVGPALGLLSTPVLAYLTWRLTLALGGSAWFAGAAALLFAIQPTLTVHAASGLETTFFAALLIGALVLRSLPDRGSKHDLAASGLLAAAALTRPEALLAYGVLELQEAYCAFRRSESRRQWVRGVARRIAPLAAASLHIVWRVSYYGDVVPNTAHAKLAPGLDIWSDGLRYASDAIQHFGPFLFLIPLFLLGSSVGRQARWACVSISLLYTMFVVYVGGDYMPTYRYLLPVIPLWCALAASSLSLVGHRIANRRGQVIAALLLGLLVVFQTSMAYADGDFWRLQGQRHLRLVAAGKKLNEVLPQDAWIAASAAGRVPYFSRRRCVDMMGLNDRHIAMSEPQRNRVLRVQGHPKGDGRYVLDRRPDVIVFLWLVALDRPLAANSRWRGIARNEAFGISEEEILADPRFLSEYRLYSVPLPEVEAYLNFFARPESLRGRSIDGLLEAGSAAPRN